MDREQPSQDQGFSEYKSVKTIEGQSSGTQGNRLSEVKSRIEELHKEQEAAHNRSDILMRLVLFLKLTTFYRTTQVGTRRFQ